MSIRSNIRKLPVTTSAHPHFTPVLNHNSYSPVQSSHGISRSIAKFTFYLGISSFCFILHNFIKGSTSSPFDMHFWQAIRSDSGSKSFFPSSSLSWMSSSPLSVLSVIWLISRSTVPGAGLAVSLITSIPCRWERRNLCSAIKDKPGLLKLYWPSISVKANV